MQKLYNNYIDNFKGLSLQIWLLSLVTFINRAGAMVIPFLSLYLVKDLGFTKPEVGWIMTAFGLGALTGTWIGGKLTDLIGFYKVIIGSLFFRRNRFYFNSVCEYVIRVLRGCFFR